MHRSGITNKEKRRPLYHKMCARHPAYSTECWSAIKAPSAESAGLGNCLPEPEKSPAWDENREMPPHSWIWLWADKEKLKEQEWNLFSSNPFDLWTRPEYSTKERLIPPTWKENIKTYSAWTLPECGLILVAHRQPFRRAFQYDFFSCFIDSINVCSIDQNTFMTLHNFRIIDQL